MERSLGCVFSLPGEDRGAQGVTQKAENVKVLGRGHLIGLKSMAAREHHGFGLKYRSDLTFRVKIQVIQTHEGKIKI
jgi:hypothetical protein